MIEMFDGEPLSGDRKVALSIRREVALEAIDGLLRVSRTHLVKATTPSAIASRDALIADRSPEMEAELAEYFRGFFERNLPGLDLEVAKALRDIPDPDGFGWAAERDLLRRLLGRWYLVFGEAAYEQAGLQLGVTIAFDIEQPGVAGVMDRLAARVTGITETSRGAIADLVASAHRAGTPVVDVEQQLRGLFTTWTTSRAHTVALTESANAYALASAAAWEDSGLVDSVRIFDGTDCGWTSHDDPDLANGSVRTLEEYKRQPLSHPNCQRAAAPVSVR
jgi:hypothetical protein